MSKRDFRPNAAEALAAVTGRPKDEFEPDLEVYPFPDPDDLKRVPDEDLCDED